MNNKKKYKSKLNRIDLAEGFEFLVDENINLKDLTPEQKSKLECFCKNNSYDYLALSSFISAIVNNYTETLDDIDIIVAMLSSIINDLLLLRIIRATCEKNVNNTVKGLEPASTLAPGFLFGINEASSSALRSNTSYNNSKKVKKIKKVKRVKKLKNKV